MVSTRAASIFNGSRLSFYVPFMVSAEAATFFNGFRWVCNGFMVSAGAATFLLVSTEVATYLRFSLGLLRFFSGFR